MHWTNNKCLNVRAEGAEFRSKITKIYQTFLKKKNNDIKHTYIFVLPPIYLFFDFCCRSVLN